MWSVRVRLILCATIPNSINNINEMAARNRPRNGLTKEDATDAHEERNMWSQIVTDIKRLRTTHAKAAEIAKAQVDMEAKMGKSQ